ncbi:MAG: RNA polymerase sigma factor [Oscillospiraceae bacterium]|jgi:RNA polymerase sigma-70 factor (ECF subfamily)|nr:RNA polymerase sigma factor [Oscillospiraceae bacterium]
MAITFLWVVVAWILTIARNKALNLYRKNKLRRNLAENQAKEEAILMESTEEYSEILNTCLKLLNSKKRQILTLRLSLDLTHKEIARIMDIPEGSVRRNYSEAINTIKQHFSKEELV